MNNERTGLSVLVVEDEAWIRELWTEELEEDAAGYRIIPVAGARAALPVLLGGGLLAAIIDIGLPEMSGEALIHVARSIDPSLPIVAVTGFDARQYEHLADRGIRVLQKPFRTSWLLFNLKALLARRAEVRHPRGPMLRRVIC